jgi:thiol:disulfide interchange protein DsbA
MHVNDNFLLQESSIRQFFGRFGIDEKQFEDTFDAPAVADKVIWAEELSRAMGVVKTPSFVINGRYVSSASMAGSNEALLQVVNQLARSELVELASTDSEP